MNTILNLLSCYKLNEDEQYCVYRICPDGWPWGYNGSYTDPTDVSNVYRILSAYPDTLGVWITKESGDGTTDITIIKTFRKAV